MNIVMIHGQSHQGVTCHMRRVLAGKLAAGGWLKKQRSWRKKRANRA